MLAASTALVVTPAVAATGEVLILESTVTGGEDSLEANAVEALGKTPVLVDDATWGGMTTAQFALYDAIILGDPTCGGGDEDDAAEANAAVWGPAITGNVIINGTDPVFHSSSGGGVLTTNSVAFAADEVGQTGAYISLSCYYDFASTPTDVAVLEGLGDFQVQSAECHNDAHIVATHPALSGLDDDDLSNWFCSVHEEFTTWPDSFLVLAIAEEADGSYTANDGTVGTPYILARGEELVAISDIALTPTSDENPVGASHTVTATVTSDGTPVSGAVVTFTIISGPHAPMTDTDTTDSSGMATFTYIGTATGTDQIRATFVDAEDRTQISNTVTKTWVPPYEYEVDPATDTTAPAIGHIHTGFAASSILQASTAKVSLRWSATDDTAVAGYRLQRSVNGGRYRNVSLATATSTSKATYHAFGTSYRYRAKAVDAAGNWSAWRYSATFRPKRYQENNSRLDYSAGWARAASSTASGGYVKNSRAAGQDVSLTFRGKGVAWVAPRGANLGKAKVYIDGVRVATVDLYRSTAQARRVVFSTRWGSVGTHTLRIVVSGTSGRPLVTNDAILIL